MPKVELEVPENMLSFLQAFSKFTNKPVEVILQQCLSKSIAAELTRWGKAFGVSLDDLKAQYQLEVKQDDNLQWSV